MATIPPADAAAFFDDLVRCETRLYNAIGEALRAHHTLTTTQFECLRYLRDHPHSRVADIAAAFAAGLGATSKLVDRLEEQAWVSRRPNPDDRRSTLVDLTAVGRRLVAKADRTFESRLDALLSETIGARRLSETAAGLRTLRSALEASKLGLPIG